MFKTLCMAAVTGVALIAASAAVPGKALAATAAYTKGDTGSPDRASAKSEHQQFAQKRGGGGGKKGAKRSKGASSGSRGAKTANRPSAGGNKKPAGGGNKKPDAGGKKKPDRDVNVNRNVNVNVNVRHRGHGWRGAHWGVVVFGVTLGTAIIVAANTPPYPPDPTLCWTWTNAALTSGYWYYCDGP